MRVLICIPHFYAVSSHRHEHHGSSLDPVTDRARSVDFCLRQLLSLTTGYNGLVGTESEDAETVGNADVATIDSDVAGDIVFCTHEDNHILGALEMRGFKQHQTRFKNPRYLGYACRHVFAECKDDYDLFIYAEDDTAILDPEFLSKIKIFYNTFGPHKAILPHRYELFSRLALKVYLDQPAPVSFRRRPDLPAELQLQLPSFCGSVFFDHTLDYSSGCFAITRDQLKMWMTFDDFTSPREGIGMDELEQAGGVLGGRYPVYKPSRRNLRFLEVHHVPNKATNARTPREKLLKIILDRRTV